MVARRQAKNRRTMTPNMLLELRAGRPYFSRELGGDGFGGDVEAMRAAWCDPQVRETCRRHHRHRGMMFGEVAFGADGRGGMVRTDGDLPEAQADYLAQRNPLPSH